MTFLNPLVLFGLAAAAIPIIIHLLTLRKLKTIEFSTLRFLKELQKTKMRRVKIRQWLLLAVRTLLIIAVVMAFARPALRGSLLGTIGTHAKSTLVILLDDSPSMGVRSERGILFARAKEVVLRLLELLKEGDEAYLLKLSEVRHQGAVVPVHSADPVRDALSQSVPSQETIPYRDAFGAAAKILAASRNFNHEVYLITDGQATQFRDSRPGQDGAPSFDDRTKLFLVDLRAASGEAAPNNAGIAALDVKSRIIAQDKSVALQVVMRNYGSASLKNSVLSIYVDGVRVVQQTQDVPPLGSATVNASVVPKKRGILFGYAQIDDDLLDLDNKRFFVLNVPQDIGVACIGASQVDIRLPQLALSLDNDSSTAGLFSVRQIPEAQLSSIDLGKFDVLLLAGIKDFSPAEAERVAQFVRAGGGLVMFPGKGSDIRNTMEALFTRLGLPPLAGVELGKTDGSSFLSFKKVDYDHPLFAGLFEERGSGGKGVPTIESPRVISTLIPQLGPRGNSIVTLSNGASFLTEYPVGGGRVLLFSVEAGLTWSDFPLKGLFVPLLHRSVMYLTSQHQVPPSFTAGDRIRFTQRLKGRAGNDQYVFRSPGGTDEKLVPQISTVTGMATFQPTNSSDIGIYELRRVQGSAAAQRGKGVDLLSAVAVNAAPEESDLRRVQEDNLEMFWKSVGLTPGQTKALPAVEKIEAVILESRFGVELWRYFLGFALLLGLVEMVLGREPKTTSEQAG